jgi:hypothetical protein
MMAALQYNAAVKALQRALVEHRTGNLVGAEAAINEAARELGSWRAEIDQENEETRRTFLAQNVPPHERGRHG